MREILFRGKAANRIYGREYRTNYKNGDWVYGLLTDVENYAGFAEMTNTNGVSGIEVDKNTVGQFTGRRDKNCKMVFEHDILQLYRVWEDGTVDKYAVAVVLFSTHDQAYVLCCGNDLNVRYDDFGNYGKPEYYEVIGNIHDNPELVEVQK